MAKPRALVASTTVWAVRRSALVLIVFSAALWAESVSRMAAETEFVVAHAAPGAAFGLYLAQPLAGI